MVRASSCILCALALPLSGACTSSNGNGNPAASAGSATAGGLTGGAGPQGNGGASDASAGSFPGGGTATGSSGSGSSGSSSGSTGLGNGGSGSGGSGDGSSGSAADTGGTSAGGKGDATEGGSTGTLTVQLNQTKQTMDGFGVTGFIGYAPLTDAEMDAFFNPTVGIGLSIVRLIMAPSGTAEATSFAEAKRAIAHGATTLIGTARSAPAACKTNHKENDGGHLIADDGGACYQAWAQALASFPADVKSAVGVDLYAMSMGIEPDFASCGTAEPCNGNYASMLYTADEVVAFMKVFGPKLHSASPNTKLMTPEPEQWSHLWSNHSAEGSTDPLKGMGYDYGHALAKDAVAWAQVDLIGVHGYESALAQPWPSDVPQTKPLWQTEVAGEKWRLEAGPSVDIDNGLAVAAWIHDAIVNGPASAWLYFQYKAPFTDDNEGLLLKDGTDTKRHYTLGNFSKFIRPGYTRVNITGSNVEDVLLSAYKGDDQTVVIVAINQGSALVSLPIAISGAATPSMLTPWVTSPTDDLVNKSAVPVSAGSFTAMLGGKSVTTFVGK
jgi:glucuronoarabinoxylan endo-1,4-beta-xylanase